MKVSASKLFYLATSLLSWSIAATKPLTAAQLRARDHRVQQFEERFLDTLAWQHNNNTVKLVGYMKIRMSGGHLTDLEQEIKARPDEWAAFTSAFFDEHEKVLRVYFPVEGALVYHDGALVEASHMGEYPHHEMISGDCSVVGRPKTEHVHGVDTNHVEDGIIYLAEPAVPVRTYGEKANVFMYDFGWRLGHEHDHDHGHGHDHLLLGKREGSGGSCKQNHGGRVCSQVYNINNGRCARDYSKCIDYNGWPITECKSKSKKGFIGSDCFDAVADGHCWNEVEGAVEGHE
jgi:hypothetical protein